MDKLVEVTGTDCDVVVIIPLYRQPALFSEAIASVLAQQAAPSCRIIVVLDGCVYRQSLESARLWARAHAPQVVVLAQPNGGLSAARNAGIRFALQAWPRCRALFFLDADNRIGPHFLRRACDALAAAPPEVGWLYPDFDLFGIAGAWSTAGSHHLLQHLTENVCDAAALVRREVCEAGIVFDETLRANVTITSMGISTAGFGLVPWTKDNMDAVKRGWIMQADTIEGLAGKIKEHKENLGKMVPGNLVKTVNRFNEFCKAGKDADFDRRPGTLGPVEKPPFYALPLYAGGPNTKGGIECNAKREVLDWAGKPIPRLYTAGEISSALKFVYQGGGNLTECIVMGRIAGKNAASLKPWK